MTKRLTIALIALVALVLVAVLPASATYYNVNNTVNAPGGSVYIGEQQLNIQPLVNSYPAGGAVSIGWWASAASVTSTAPSQQYNVSSLNPSSFYASPSGYGNYLGNWYAINGSGTPNTTAAFFTVVDPSLAIDVWDINTSTTVSSGTVIQGDLLTFRINTNLQSAIDPNYRTSSVTPAVGSVDIQVKPSSGNTYASLFVNSTSGSSTYNTQNIRFQPVNQSLWFWGIAGNGVPSTTATSGAGAIQYAWATGATDSTGNNAYPAGVYTVTAQSDINGQYDNYLNGGAYYTGKTISQPVTVTIASNTVSISANVDSVVRSKPFSVTITGKPGATYHLWVKGVSSLDGTYDNQPPIISPNQVGVTFDNESDSNAFAYNQTSSEFPLNANTAYANGNYTYQNGVQLWNDVAHGTYGSTGLILGNGTFEYANVTLNSAGTRTIQWTTTNWTKAQQYTIRVEQNFGGATGYKYDEVKVQVQKGAVTIVAAGSQSYYLGEEVQFSGTNTESQTTYLFITGPNLPTQGGALWSTNPRYAGSANPGITNGNASDFQQVSVNGDNTWSWNWGTTTVALDAGTYTVYAVSQPNDANHLSNAAYGTVSIIIKKPFVSATASQSTVAQGDPIYITGTAEGQPSQGVQLWILGKNYALVATEAVNSDSSFSYEIKGATTSTMYSGQYFVVVQHPMQNGVFDVAPATASGTVTYPQNSNGASVYVWNDNPSNPGVFTANGATNDFALTGAGSLQGSDAAEALVQALNSANVDDTYTKLQFLVETPVITITPVGDHSVGDKFTITATTNLAVGDNVLFTVYSSSFQPTDKTQSGEFSGASGTVAVTQGTSGLNALSFDVDASTFKPDEYLVTATAVGLPDTNNVPTGTALFNVLQASAQTATPTPVATVTTAAVQTTVPTPVPTTATPTKTPTQPGFGALVALIGLGAVALFVVRKH
jgi:PGF-CTERM protein